MRTKRAPAPNEMAKAMLCLTDGQSQVAALRAILARLRDAASVEALLADESPDVFDAAVRTWLAG